MCRVIEKLVYVEWQKLSWCWVTLSAKWQSNIVLSYYKMIYLEVSKFWADMAILLELVNKEEDKKNVLEVQNLMLVALEEKNLEEDELWGRYNVSYLTHWNPRWI